MKYYIPDNCDEKGDKDNLIFGIEVNMKFRVEIWVKDMT